MSLKDLKEFFDIREILKTPFEALGLAVILITVFIFLMSLTA